MKRKIIQNVNQTNIGPLKMEKKPKTLARSLMTHKGALGLRMFPGSDLSSR